MTTYDLIHYGADKYDKDKFMPISNRKWVKPKGGLWTSPVTSERGWSDWSQEAQWGDLSESFTLKFSGSVLKIDCYDDISKLPWLNDNIINFDDVIDDAIHLTVKGEEETRFSHPKSLYGWDCETVLILNPDCITTYRY